ncbi:MAG: hypothetical protein O2856_17470 [Planctomycetota bacterium]|nr:hypothetical protein [Planctomycetota bacterium]
MKGRFHFMALCFLISAWPGLGDFAVAQDAVPTTASGFLQSHFKILKGRPVARNLQRTSHFFRIDQTADRVQLAIVLDGTESMTKEFEVLLADLTAIASGLRDTFEKKNTPLELALVIYRDTDAPSGSVSIPSKEFIDDIKVFQAVFAEAKVEAGSPNFEERADEGLYRALDELNWAPPNENVTRWILLCGDAPPYPEADSEYEGRGARKDFRPHTTAEIVDLAVAKKVRIHCVQASSGFLGPGGPGRPELVALDPKLVAAAAAAQPFTAKFMGAVAQQTGGNYVNMWNRDAIRAAMDPDNTLMVEMPPIRKQDVEDRSIRPKFGQLPVDAVTVAVLPHSPLPTWKDPPADDSGKPNLSVAVISEIQRVLGSVGNGGLSVISQDKVLPAIEAAEKANNTTENQLAAVALALKADYVIWGSVKELPNQLEFTSGIYQFGTQIEKQTMVADANAEIGQLNIVEQVTRRLCQNASGKLPNARDKAAFADADPRAVTPIARDLQAQRALLAGLAWQERALAYLRPDKETQPADAKLARELLEQAIVQYDQAIRREPDNPFVYMLLSNCYYNLCDYNGTSDEQTQSYINLRKAYDLRDHDAYANTPVKNEIEAFYELFQRKDIATAVSRFENLLTTSRSVRGQFSLRAHWMLAGIRLGDWGVAEAAPQVVNVEKARDHIISILAHWPKSPEAEFYRKHLKLDPANNPLPNVAPSTPSIPLGSDLGSVF